MKPNFLNSKWTTALLFAATFLPLQFTAQEKEPLNIILLIGDGMGIAQVSTAFHFGDKVPSFQNFTSIGLSQTSSSSNRVTDSAAGATAISTGSKTYNRAIGVNQDTIAVPTLLEQLQTVGYNTGLVSLTSITHATPASFYAHVKDRDMHEEIAQQLVNSNVNFLVGGGRQFFTKRKDKANLLEQFEKKQYKVSSTLSKPDQKRNNLYLLAEDALPNKVEGRGDVLPDATKLALDYLSESKKPFFLMVEGSFIDWGGHAKSQDMVVGEVLDFDKTIEVVLEFYKKNPNTLIVVTADHETGGVSVGKYTELDPVSGKRRYVASKVQLDFNTDQHTASLVPVFAMGPNEELFQGVYQNNKIYHKLIEALKKSKINLTK